MKDFALFNLVDHFERLLLNDFVMDVHEDPRRDQGAENSDRTGSDPNIQDVPRCKQNQAQLGKERPVETPGDHVVLREELFLEAVHYHASSCDRLCSQDEVERDENSRKVPRYLVSLLLRHCIRPIDE